jgi:hypothetical protein
VHRLLLAVAASLLPVQLLVTVDQSPATESQTGASRVALATVLDPRNRPVLDVGVDDFVIQEAGATREVLSVRPADYPIVLLLDTGIDARTDLPMMRRAAAHFIERIGQRPIAIGTLGGTPKLVASLEDEAGRQVGSEKLVEIAFDGTKPVKTTDQFGIGLKT